MYTINRFGSSTQRLSQSAVQPSQAQRAPGLVRRLGGILLASGLLAMTLPVAAHDMPKDAKPLSEILKMLEQTRFDHFTEIEFEDGQWEIEGMKGEEKVEVEVDAVSGKEVVDD